MDSWVLAIVFTFITCTCSISYLFFRTKTGKNGSPCLPPGPRGLPLIGHLHLLGELPHHTLQKLAKKYGPIMSLRLGSVPAIIVTSPEYAELFLKTHDLVFASRPKLQAADYISYGQKNLALAKYGPYWRNMRRLCTVELLSSTKIEMFMGMRQEEVTLFVKSMKDASVAGCALDVSTKIESLIEDMTNRLVLGKKEDMLNFKSGMREAMRLAGLFNIADYVPSLGAFDLQGLKPRMEAVAKVLDGFLEKIIDEHVHDAKELNGRHRDFVDVMLSLMESNNERELHIERDHIKAIVLDMLAAAIDTSSTTIEWIIAELLKHPRVMKLVQQELETVVRLDRMVEEADLIKLDYLKLVIKESMRIHPVAPLLIPHESMEDITINGYFIPNKSRVLINTWAIGRDTNVWSDNAEEFCPERFVGTDIDIHGHDFRFLPFGSGRRKCPGMQLGMTVVQIIVAQLVHCFDLELPDGMSPEELDMTEKFGLTLPRANHLQAIPTYRLHINL